MLALPQGRLAPTKQTLRRHRAAVVGCIGCIMATNIEQAADVGANTGELSALADWKRCVRATEATKTIVLRKISFLNRTQQTR